MVNGIMSKQTMGISLAMEEIMPLIAAENRKGVEINPLVQIFIEGGGGAQ